LSAVHQAEPSPRKRKPYVPTGRPRGRPKGSRSRPKPVEALPVVKPAALRIANAARYADVSVSTMRKWDREGLVESKSIGSLKLILVPSIDRLLRGGT
jgi:hypothetical protein